MLILCIKTNFACADSLYAILFLFCFYANASFLLINIYVLTCACASLAKNIGGNVMSIYCIFDFKELIQICEYKLLCHCSLLEWSRCWGFSDFSSLSEFLSSLSLVSWFPSVYCTVCSFYFLLFIIMNFLYFSFFYHL